MFYLLSFPGCCWISSSRYFLANSIKPFIGRFGLSGSAEPDAPVDFFLAGDMGGDIALPRTEDSREAMLWRSGPPPPELEARPLGPPGEGESWSAKSWLKKKLLLMRCFLQ